MTLKQIVGGRAFAWTGWALAGLLALATLVQSVRLNREPEENPRAVGAPPAEQERGEGGEMEPPGAEVSMSRMDELRREAKLAQERAERLETRSRAEAVEGDFACTLVVGFSQTSEWYGGSGGFEQAADDERWELLWVSGASIDRWADPAFVGWQRRVTSPCTERPDQPDRVVLTITGAEYRSDVSWWERQIEEAVLNVEGRYPSAGQVVLQAVVGGPNNGFCFGPDSVRASFNHPFIDIAIADIAGAEVVVGPSPEVRSCSEYRDSVGHLTPEAADEVATAIAEAYGAASP